MRLASAVLLLPFAVAACAGGPADSVDTASQEQRSVAVLFVERQATDSAAGLAHVGGRFVQFTGIEADALPDLLGIPTEPGQSSGCAVREDATVDSSGVRAEARLLDVGPISVQAGDRVLQLEPRRFPDLWNVVSGVIYATDGEIPAADWHFSANGNAQSHTGAFDVEARAPEDLASVTVADQALTPGASLTVPRRGFAVRWNRGEQGDGVAVTFEGTAAGDHAGTIVCSAVDEGALSVDATWAERVADLVQSGGTVTVHRVRTRPFTAAQLDNARVVFDLSVRGHVAAE